MDRTLTEAYEAARPELTAYLCRLVLRPAIAEELAQTAYLRSFEARERLPGDAQGLRAWLFKVATHLAFDELKRHATWREDLLGDLRTLALADTVFQGRSEALAGTPETVAIAREHLAVCLACTLRNLPEHKAAAVLLKEVHGFSVAEAAGLLEATPAQVKNWLQEGRAHLQARYGRSCALLAKEGVCHQCVELDGYLGAHAGPPLAPGAPLDERLAVVASLRARSPGPWHRIMFDLMDDLA